MKLHNSLNYCISIFKLRRNMINMENLATCQENKVKQSWALRNDSFTGDALIEAYLKGCSEGVERFKKKLMQKLQHNIELAQNFGTDFINEVNRQGVICTMAHLKYLEINRYKVIFVLNKEIYYDLEKMRPYYLLAEKFEDRNSTEEFMLELAFIPEVESINTHRLISDGFIFHYNGELPQS